MADNDDNDNDDNDNDHGENPIPELANLTIDNLTLEKLLELRKAINLRIDVLVGPPLVALDLDDILQRCAYPLQNVVAAVRKSTGIEAQQVEAVYAVALHRIGWNGASHIRNKEQFDVGRSYFATRHPNSYINTIFRPDPDRGVDLFMVSVNENGGGYCIHLIQIKHGKTKISVGSNNNFSLKDHIRPKLYVGRDQVKSWFPDNFEHRFHLFNIGGYDAKSIRSMGGENGAFVINFMETNIIKQILLNVMEPHMDGNLGHLA